MKLIQCRFSSGQRVPLLVQVGNAAPLPLIIPFIYVQLELRHRACNTAAAHLRAIQDVKGVAYASNGTGAATVFFKVALMFFIRLLKFTQWQDHRSHWLAQLATGVQLLPGDKRQSGLLGTVEEQRGTVFRPDVRTLSVD